MGKCKFWKKCKMYKDENRTCNYDNGAYNGDQYANCWVEMNENK